MAKEKTKKSLFTRVANSFFAIGVAVLVLALVATFSPAFRHQVYALVVSSQN